MARKKGEIGGSIKLDGTQEYRQAISNINKDLQLLSSELKKNASAFGDNNKSVEALTQRNTDFNKQIETQKEKVKALEAALKNSKEQYGETDKKTKDWQISLNKAQTELNQMKTTMNGYEAELKEVSDGSQKAADNTKKIGTAADQTHPKMKAFSAGSVVAVAAIGAAVTGVIAGIASLGKKLIDTSANLAKYGDDIAENAAKLRITTTEYQKLNYIAIATGTSVDAVGGAFAKTSKAMGQVNSGNKEMTNLFKKLDVSIYDANGTLRDNENVFWDLVFAIGKLDSETQQEIDANTLWGRSFQELTPLIAEGRTGIEKLNKKFEEMGISLDEETIQKLADFNDTLDAFKIKTQIALAPLVEGLIPAFTSIADVIGKKLAEPRVQDALTNIGDKIGKLAENITDKLVDFLTSDDFSTFADNILKVGESVFGGFYWLVNEAFPWVVDHKTEISDALTAIGLAMLGIGIATGSLKTAIGGLAVFAGTGFANLNGWLEENQALVDKWSENNNLRMEESKGFWGGYFTYAGNQFLDLQQWLETKAPESLRIFAEQNGLTTNGIINAWDAFKVALLKIAYDITSYIKTSFEGMGTAISGVFEGVVGGIKGMINSIVGAINSAINAINLSLISAFQKAGIGISYIPMIPQWNAEGAIFDKPTILPSLAGWQGVGEKGAEIIAPLAKLEQTMINAVKKSGGGGNTINLYFQKATESQIDYAVWKVKRELGMAQL